MHRDLGNIIDITLIKLTQTQTYRYGIMVKVNPDWFRQINDDLVLHSDFHHIVENHDLLLNLLLNLLEHTHTHFIWYCLHIYTHSCQQKQSTVSKSKLGSIKMTETDECVCEDVLAFLQLPALTEGKQSLTRNTETFWKNVQRTLLVPCAASCRAGGRWTVTMGNSAVPWWWAWQTYSIDGEKILHIGSTAYKL